MKQSDKNPSLEKEDGVFVFWATKRQVSFYMGKN